MGVRQGGSDRPDDRPGVRPGQSVGRCASEQGAQVLAREQLHGVEREFTVPLEFVDLHDIRMRETAHAIEFSLQSLHEIRAPFDAVAKHLDRHRCGTFGARDTQPGRRLVDLAHAAAAQQALHNIPIAQYTPDVDGRRIGRPLGVTRGGRCRR
jgi:hypothetical protein